MPRYEITGTATDVFTLEQIQGALSKVLARKINRRRAFGWSNQPHVATFEAANQQEADTVARQARKELPDPNSFPALLAWEYQP